jgi:hypothetical protein
VVPKPAGAPVRRRRSGHRPGGADRLACATHDAAVGELRALVSRRFTAALGVHPSPAEWRAHAGGRDVDRLFWSLMLEPTPVSTSAAWVDRLLDRLVLLHACYEQAMAQLRPADTPVTRAGAARSGA